MSPASNNALATPLAIVPLRAGKTRLADVLDYAGRAQLREAMLKDVVAALRGAGLERIIVAASDSESAALGRDLGLQVHRDPPKSTNLNHALASAAELAEPLRAILIVTADLPALDVLDVRLLLEARGKVVLAPTNDGGTGGLLRRPGHIIATAYGPESAVLHAARAIDRGLTPTVLNLPGFRVDVDTPEDLESLRGMAGLGAATTTWVRQHFNSQATTSSPPS